MPSFADITQRLGEMATGLTVGTLEREQADRTEVRDLIERSVSHGRQGVDYAPNFTPENVRPGTVSTLQDLTARSGAATGPTSLQYPWLRDQTILQEREDARVTAAEVSRERAQEADLERQQRTFENQQRLVEERARRPSRLDSLQPGQWDQIRSVTGTVVDDALSAQIPDYFVSGQRGVAVNPIYAAARRRIAQEIETRLPFLIPNNLASIHGIVSGIYRDLVPGITARGPGGGFLGSGYFAAPGVLEFDPSRAVARRPDTASGAGGPGTAGTEVPSDGTSLAPTGTPGQVGGQPGQVGRSNLPQEAQMQRVLARYREPIMAAAREFNLPPELVASISFAEGAQMVQGPVLPNRTERAFGVMQILPSTYAEVARRIREGRPNTDVDANYRVGAAYFAEQMRNFNGDTALALAAYNWGPDRVQSLLRRHEQGTSRAVIFAQMPAETRAYIEKIGAAMGGWDGPERNTLPRLSGRMAGGNGQPPGTPTGNVPQIAPTPQHVAGVNQYIDLTVQSAIQRITSVTNPTQRSVVKEQLLANYPAIIRRTFMPQYTDHIMAELRRQLSRIN